MDKDYYGILGVDKGATDSEIRKSYRKLAAKYHPDKHANKSESERRLAEDKFKDVNEAYQVLSDTEKRKKYDMFGTADIDYHGTDGDIFNMFRHMHEMHDGFFKAGFGGVNFGNSKDINGTDCRITVSCTLEEVYNGVTKKFSYSVKGKCPDCGGSGSKTKKTSVCGHCNGTGVYQKIVRHNVYGKYGGYTQINQVPCEVCNGTGVVIQDPCRKCGGSGLVDMTVTVSVDIPNNSRDGSLIIIPEKGNAAPNGKGKTGNLIVMVSITKHDVFGVCDNGYDLYCKIGVNVLDCVTGCDYDVKCIDGTKARVAIQQGSRENTKIVVNGKGMPKSKGYGYGDMFVYINHIMPSSISEEEMGLIDKLKQSENFKS